MHDLIINIDAAMIRRQHLQCGYSLQSAHKAVSGLNDWQRLEKGGLASFFVVKFSQQPHGRAHAARHMIEMLATLRVW